jgi:hypothetical protein
MIVSHSGSRGEMSEKVAIAAPTRIVFTTSVCDSPTRVMSGVTIRFDASPRCRGRQHHHAGMERRVTQADLQQQRHQEGHAAAAEPGEQISQQADAEGVSLENLRWKQRVRLLRGTQPVSQARLASPKTSSISTVACWKLSSDSPSRANEVATIPTASSR